MQRGKNMDIEAQEFYSLLGNSKFKQIASVLQDGFSGIYLVLKILSDAQAPLSAGDISTSLGVSTARTAVALNCLEKKGFVQKSKFHLDARKTMVELTTSGQIELENRKTDIFLLINQFLNKLDQNEKVCLFDILKKLLSD